jgi:hypothetical protein
MIHRIGPRLISTARKRSTIGQTQKLLLAALRLWELKNGYRRWVNFALKADTSGALDVHCHFRMILLIGLGITCDAVGTAEFGDCFPSDKQYFATFARENANRRKSGYRSLRN